MKATLRALSAASLLVCSGWVWAAPPDGGITDLQTSVAGKVIGTGGGTVQLPHPAADQRSTLASLLATPLTADAAVRIALLNNPELQAAMGPEGLSLSDATGRDTPAKLRAQQAITVLSAQAFKAWVNAVAATHSAKLLREAKATAETSGELTRRMVRAGNVSKLTQAQSQAVLSDAALALARAEQAAFAARETLTVTLGLWGQDTQFTLPTALPALPAQAMDLPDVEARAVNARTDLQLAALQWQRKQQSSVPDSADALWDAMGDAARVRAQAVQLRSQARMAYHQYRSSWDIATHLQAEVLPVRQFIHDELVLRYNGMLTSLFDVLADSQALTMAKSAHVAAQRDFWLAHANLQALLAGAPLDAIGGDASTNTSEARPATSPGGH
ncbi:TolC family protein [Rhodoferax sp.]|uniref:TolC family protein n=1 Tax=Rhodoferax sp. TaxID=50421 RepID=UPI002ACDEFC5|nr:TolC family protein [Rhodoferax sp.]MDZ7920903.1 TolC family protein [Rhodoferax sp.]